MAHAMAPMVSEPPPREMARRRTSSLVPQSTIFVQRYTFPSTPPNDFAPQALWNSFFRGKVYVLPFFIIIFVPILCIVFQQMDMDSSIDTSLGQFQYKGNRVDMADNDLLSVSCPDDNGFVTDLKINRNEIYADESWVVYSKDGKALITCIKKEELVNYKVKEGTIVICDYAFWLCGEIREVIIPDSVRAIGKEAFGNCNSLLNIKLPCQLEVIREKTFGGCRALSYINRLVSNYLQK